MHRMNDPRPDLNLLAVFEAVLREGSVTRAAAALNLSQPAVSHALARLRDLTGDALFLRRGNGLHPSPRAEAMAPQVAAALQAARAALRPQGFDPGREEGEIVLAASDYALMALVPGLLARLVPQAPGLRLRLVPVGGGTPQALARGALLASFWAGAAPGEGFDLRPLFRERLVGIAAPDHALLAGGITLDRWTGAAQAVVSLGDPGANPVEAQLQAMGRHRRVALVTHSFAGALSAVRQAGLVMALPERLAAAPEAAGLHRFALPLALPDYPYGLLSHASARGDARLDWLAAELAASLAA